MGKTTRYHPISLPVIRGAAAYGGIILGRIVQRTCNETLQTASYSVEIKEIQRPLTPWNY